jgi:hypothetical protein
MQMRATTVRKVAGMDDDGGGGPSGSPPRLPAAAVAAGAVGATVALLAIAAAGSGSSPFGPARPDQNRPPAIVLTLALVTVGGLLLFGLVALVLAILWRERIELPKRPKGGSWASLLLLLLIILVIWQRPDLGELPPQLGAAAEGPPATTAGDLEPAGPPQASGWLPLAAVAVVLVVAATASALAERRRRRRARLSHSEGDLLAELVEAALVDLAGETDPRRAVIAAYAVMERGLAAAGMPRRIGETPMEHTTRVLLDAHVPAAPVATLAALFERARFSHHPIDQAMRTEALAALEAVRAALRERAAAAAPDWADPEPAEPGPAKPGPA